MQARMLRVEDIVGGYLCGGVDELRGEEADGDSGLKGVCSRQ